MEELKILLQKILNKDLQQIILSNSRHPEQTQKVKIRPVLIRRNCCSRRLLTEELRCFTRILQQNS